MSRHPLAKLVSGFLVILSTISIPAVWADDSQLVSMVENLQRQMSEMQKTVNQQNQKIRDLESRPAQIQVPSSKGGEITTSAPPMSDSEFKDRLDSALGGANKWLKDLKFSGDLRLRYEGFAFHSGSPSETDPRNRFRFRLRYGFEKKFNDDMKVGFGMASGAQSAGDSNDPTSTNSTFTNNFNFKPIFIEKAYATYTPHVLAHRGILDKTEVTAGKFTNPFEKGASDMVWDRDVRPEGIYEKIDFKLYDGDNVKLNSYITGAQYILHEDATLGRDAQMFGVQLGINPVFYTPFLDRPVDWLHAFSFYDYQNFAKNSNFFIGTTSLANGNINMDTISTELDAGKFKIYEYYQELAIYPYGLPVRFGLDLAGNPADAANGSLGTTIEHGQATDFAYGMSVKLGGINKKGDWEAGYQYKYIGANSVVGAFNDSDFGSGYAGKRGSVFKAGYALTDTITLNGAMFFVSNLNPGNATGVINQQQRRFQLDLSWKF